MEKEATHSHTWLACGIVNIFRSYAYTEELDSDNYIECYMYRLKSLKNSKYRNAPFHPVKRTIPSDETHSFILWNEQFQALKLYWSSYSKNHAYAYEDLNRLIKDQR